MTPHEIMRELQRVAPIWAQRAEGGSDFARGKSAVCLDIAAKIERYGSFASERQRQYALKLIEWASPRARERASASDPSGQSDAEQRSTAVVTISSEALQRINRLFTAAREHGIQRPRIDLRLAGRPALRLSPAPSAGRNPGAIYIRADNRYAGQITPEGAYRPVSGRPEGTDEFVREFGDNPLSVARAHGHATGACCFCRRTLTDARSVAMGYGPICAGHYGLEWGEQRAPSVVEMTDAPNPQPAPNGVAQVDPLVERIRRASLFTRPRPQRRRRTAPLNMTLDRPRPVAPTASDALPEDDEDRHFL